MLQYLYSTSAVSTPCNIWDLFRVTASILHHALPLAHLTLQLTASHPPAQAATTTLTTCSKCAQNVRTNTQKDVSSTKSPTSTTLHIHSRVYTYFIGTGKIKLYILNICYFSIHILSNHWTIKMYIFDLFNLKQEPSNKSHWGRDYPIGGL